jgi:ABC-type molybdenum transport system ATPase subunit/photorepair protein PhrA
MSLVNASERLVALPKDEKPAGSAAEDAIVVDELRMHYGATEAVAGIDLRVARGEIFALLGPNGARGFYASFAAQPSRSRDRTNIGLAP